MASRGRSEALRCCGVSSWEQEPQVSSMMVASGGQVRADLKYIDDNCDRTVDCWLEIAKNCVKDEHRGQYTITNAMRLKTKKS